MSEDCGCEGGEPPRPGLVGGYSAVKPADQDVQDLCNKVKRQYEQRTGENLEMFKAISYSKQVVAGMKFKIKVQTGCEKYSDLVVYEPLSHVKMCPQLKDIKQNVGKCDEITL